MSNTRTPREQDIINAYSQGYLTHMNRKSPRYPSKDKQLERAYNKGFYDSLMSHKNLFTGPISSEKILSFITQLDNDDDEPFMLGRISKVLNWTLYLTLFIGSSIPILSVLVTNYDAMEYNMPAWLFGGLLHLLGFLLYCVVFQLMDNGRPFHLIKKTKFVKK